MLLISIHAFGWFEDFVAAAHLHNVTESAYLALFPPAIIAGKASQSKRGKRPISGPGPSRIAWRLRNNGSKHAL